MLRLLTIFFATALGVLAEKPLKPVPERTVVLTFDDAVASHATHVAPMLKKFGFTATFFVCEFQPDFDDKTKYMTWGQIAQLHRDGFEVASHTRSHKHVDEMAPGEFSQELSFVEQRCKELGVPRPKSFAYPAYVHTPAALLTLRERGYQFARVGGTRAYDPTADDPLLIPSFSMSGTNENAARRAISGMEQARDGKIAVLTFHGVPDTAHPHVTTTPELFERYLQFLADGKYTVLAMRDLAKFARPAARTPPSAAARYEPQLEKIADAAAWRAYFKRSDEWQAKQVAALDAELNGAGPKRAPSGGKPKFDESQLDAVLSFQLPCGGWSKALAYANGPREPGMQWTSQEEPWHYAATIDNRATTGELRFLAELHAKNPAPRVKAAILRGVDYLLEAQFPNGGWPQNYPLEGGYHDFITLNDAAMLHVLQFLDEAAALDLVDAARKTRIREAADRGNECLLRLQRRGAVWCAQYEPLTLKPAHARLFEPASLSGMESVEVIRYLMRQPATPVRTTAIETALGWYAAAERIPGESGDEKEWARFYDLQNKRPLFTGKTDGRTYATLAAMRERNADGYEWTTRKPGDLLGKWAERWRAGKVR